MPWDRIDPDRRNSLLLIGGVGLIVVLALALIGYGYYTDRIKPLNQTVLAVGDRKFDYAFMERRVVADYQDGELNTQEIERSVAQVVARIEREEVIRQTARRLEITITEDELLAQLRTMIGAPQNADRLTMAPGLRIKLQLLGLPLGEYEDIARAQVAEKKIFTKAEESVPPEAAQAFIRVIQTGGQSQALQAKQALDNGDSWALATAQYTIHPSKEQGGDVGLVPRGAFPKEVDDFIFGSNVIGRSGVIETKSGFYLVEVVGRETTLISSAARESVANATFARDLETTRDQVGSRPLLNASQVQRAIRRLIEVSGSG